MNYPNFVTKMMKNYPHFVMRKMNYYQNYFQNPQKHCFLMMLAVG
jgi:hypothetical protein